MANNYTTYTSNIQTGSVATHATYTYGQNSYNAPTTTTAPGATPTDYSSNNPYAGGSTAGTYTAQTYSSPAYTGSSYQPGTVQYNPQQMDNRYSSYLEKEYSEQGLPTNEQGQTAYDIKRGKIKSDTEAARSMRQEALQRQLAAMGLGDSGIALKQNRMMQADLERESGRMLSDVNMEELQSMERRNERLGAQAFQGEQGALGREVQRELTYAGLSLDEQRLFEEARQFDSREQFEQWATVQGLNQQERDRLFTALQNDKERALKGELTYAELNQQDKALAQDAWQFTNKIEFDAWAKQMDIDDRQADRIWQAVENEKAYERDVGLIANRLVAELSKMDYGDVLEARKAERDSKIEYYHALGESGEEMDSAELERLQTRDPLAYNSYMAGQAGKTLEEVKNDEELKTKYIDAFITSFDPKSVAFQSALSTFFTDLGVDVPEGLTTGTGGSGTNIYQAATTADGGYANITSTSDPAYTQLLNSNDTLRGYGESEVVDPSGLGNKRWTYTNLEKSLADGSVVREGDKLYTVQNKSVTKKGGANWTVYTLKAIGTGETTTITAKGE